MNNAGIELEGSPCANDKKISHDGTNMVLDNHISVYH